MLPYRYLIKPLVMTTVIFLSVILYLYVDRDISLFFKTYLQSNFHIFDYFFNHGGQGVLVLPMVGLLMIYFKFIKYNPLWLYRISYLFYILIIDHLILSSLKFCCARARPYLYTDQQIFGFYPFTFSYDYFSFPSGHTILMMTIAGFLALLLKSPWRYLVLSLGLLISFSRVWQNLHYFSDWYFSAYLSLLIFPMSTIILERVLPLKKMQALNKAMNFSSEEA